MPECLAPRRRPLRRRYLTQRPCLTAQRWLARRSMGLLASSREVRRRPEATGHVLSRRESMSRAALRLGQQGYAGGRSSINPRDKGHLIGAPFLWARGFVITSQVQLGCDPESHVPRYGNVCYCTRHRAPEQSLRGRPPLDRRGSHHRCAGGSSIGARPNADATPRRISSNCSREIRGILRSRRPSGSRHPVITASRRSMDTTATMSHFAQISSARG